MPTGYTAPVETGEIADLKTFALRCARGMCACIMQRDEPISAPITMDHPSDYHTKALAEIDQRMEEVSTWTDDQWAQEADRARTESQQTVERRRAESDEKNARYNAMLAKVEEWVPPTDDHAGLKEFMRNQLAISMESERYVEANHGPIDVGAFKAGTLRSLVDLAAYHKAEHRKELDRVASRNAWKRSLLDSFGAE